MSGGSLRYVPHDPIPMSFDIRQGQKDVNPRQTQGRRFLVGEASGALDGSFPYVGVARVPLISIKTVYMKVIRCWGVEVSQPEDLGAARGSARDFRF